ncbi:MAG: hypothetical protein Q4C98_11775 [Capnocytophaga sp.]|nr:hypothetical protein [Capnocytophaga sp.]
MSKIIITLGMLLSVMSCQGQHKKTSRGSEMVSLTNIITNQKVTDTLSPAEKGKDFYRFIERFNQKISLPIENIEKRVNQDTISAKWVNEVVIHRKKEHPKYISVQGKYEITKEFYGLYEEEPYYYTLVTDSGDKEMVFYPKIYPIGRVYLKDNYISLIVKSYGFESTSYDLWNFDKEGELLSIVCLFLGYRSDSQSPEVTYVAAKSTIDKEGVIDFNFDYSDLIIHRVYRLNEDGYFKILEEQIEDTMNDD